MTEPIDQRDTRLFANSTPLWVERWREPTGGITVARINPSSSVVVFAGIPTDPSSEWLAEHLLRVLEGDKQVHFIDQLELERPNTKVRNVYMSALKERHGDIARVHLLLNSKPMVRMIASAANMMFGGLGQFHPDSASFEHALSEHSARNHASAG